MSRVIQLSGPRRSQLPIMLLLVLVLGSTPLLPGWSARAGAVPPGPPAPPSCLGAHDLLVDHSAPTLAGGTYDRVCILHGSTVTLASGAVLRAGLLYIDASSALRSDGIPGGRPYAQRLTVRASGTAHRTAIPAG